jgi:hypothetical protein
MKPTKLTAACVIIATSTLFATASFAEFEDPEDPPVGCLTTECEEPDPPTKLKGNNGWGNGSDMVDDVVGSGTNAGSGSGATSDSKEIDGTGEDKFEDKFTDGR